MRFLVLAAALVSLVITSTGVFAGWAMDHSLWPPSGGGWRCYATCIAGVWLMASGPLLLASALSRFCFYRPRQKNPNQRTNNT